MLFRLRPYPKHWYLECFLLLCTTHCAKDVEQDTLSQASMPFDSVFGSLHSILHKDVEQGKLSQASMLLATMPKTLFSIALLFLYVLRVADSG